MLHISDRFTDAELAVLRVIVDPSRSNKFRTDPFDETRLRNHYFSHWTQDRFDHTISTLIAHGVLVRRDPLPVPKLHHFFSIDAIGDRWLSPYPSTPTPVEGDTRLRVFPPHPQARDTSPHYTRREIFLSGSWELYDERPASGAELTMWSALGGEK